MQFVAITIAISALILALCSWLVASSHLRYLGDAGYFIEQATVRRDTGRLLYTQLEFAYGPLLLLPEIWLSQTLHCSVGSEYYLTLVLESSLGLAMLAYVLHVLPIRDDLRRGAFLLFAVGAITPHLGLNYTLFRFVSPFAVLLGATHSRSAIRCALWLSVGTALELMISPELGLALAPGFMTFALLRAREEGWRWLSAAVLPAVTLASVMLIFGRPYLAMTASFSRGALNLPVGPYPHLLVYLYAAVWLVPVGLAMFLQADGPIRARLCAFYAVSLAFLPPTLGRCDPLHVFFDGVGILLLSLVAVSGAARPARRAWLLALGLLVFWNHWVNERLFDVRDAEVLRETVMPRLTPKAKAVLLHVVALHRADLSSVLAGPRVADLTLDMDQLRHLTGGASVSTPLSLTPAVELQLQQAHQYAPGYYAFWVDVMSPAAERRSIQDVNACKWMLIPEPWHADNPHTVERLRSFQGISLPYRNRRPLTYQPGELFAQNLRQRWKATLRFGPYMLYEQMPL